MDRKELIEENERFLRFAIYRMWSDPLINTDANSPQKQTFSQAVDRSISEGISIYDVFGPEENLIIGRMAIPKDIAKFFCEKMFFDKAFLFPLGNSVASKNYFIPEDPSIIDFPLIVNEDVYTVRFQINAYKENGRSVNPLEVDKRSFLERNVVLSYKKEE